MCQLVLQNPAFFGFLLRISAYSLEKIRKDQQKEAKSYSIFEHGHG
jgi:hypothetical protein